MCDRCKLSPGGRQVCTPDIFSKHDIEWQNNNGEVFCHFSIACIPDISTNLGLQISYTNFFFCSHLQMTTWKYVKAAAVNMRLLRSPVKMSTNRSGVSYNHFLFFCSCWSFFQHILHNLKSLQSFQVIKKSFPNDLLI